MAASWMDAKIHRCMVNSGGLVHFTIRYAGTWLTRGSTCKAQFFEHDET
jgi:hypothetical protein